MRHLITALLLAAALTCQLYAQIKEGETLDKIVAVVGEEIIMLSEVKSTMMQYAYQNQGIDPNDEKLREEVINSLINEKLVITKAKEDSIEVSEAEIEAEWQFMLEHYIRAYGSRERLENVYGMSVDRMKYEFRDQLKNRLLFGKIKNKKTSEISVSPREVKEFYEEYKDSIPPIPEQYMLYHIVRYIKTPDDAKEQLLKLARRVRDSILAGGSFADFARRYSKDPGSASDGGELGWVARGRLIKEFEDMAFSLQEGQISLPVETPFGYHIIQTMEKAEDKIKVRHILFKLGQTDEDKQEAINFLNDIRDSAAKGKDFEKLAKKYSEEKETQGFGGFIGKIEKSRVPGNIKSIVENLEDGEISEPHPYNADPVKPAYHIIYKKKAIPEHKANLEDDYKEIEMLALTHKQNRVFQDWIKELRETVYWERKD